jgi:uncharacterized protein YjbI with pentapeptide repeats
MIREEVKNIAELTTNLGQKNLTFDCYQPFEFRNIHFKFSLGNNFSELLNLKHSNNNGSISNQFSSISYYIFDNCSFENEIIIKDDFEVQLIFQNNCHFNHLDFSEANFKKKIRFYECRFKGKCNFENTKFQDLADFWKSTFYKSTAFYRTDFLDTTVFSACTFNENVLFTYSLFKDKIIFRGAIFKKGLDLSLSLNSGEYSFFNITLNNYVSKKHNNEDEYTQMLGDCEIPTINKKETFRIIKQHFQSNGDDLEYVKYLKLEKKPIYEIVTQNLKETKLSEFWNYLHHSFDLLSLGLNRISNNHRNSYLLGIVFTVMVGLFFFSLSLLSLPDFTIEWEPSNWEKMDLWKDYLSFMNPTHDIKLFNHYCPTEWTYFWQTWGRIFVGYGIYQTVQAFRKLK